MDEDLVIKVVDGVKQLVKEKLIEDFYDSLRRTRLKSGPLAEHRQLEIMVGFAQGCIAAGAELMKRAGLSYLHYLASCACMGANIRPVMSCGDDELHQVFHVLMDTFPDGVIPNNISFKAGNLEELREFFQNARNNHAVDPQDIN